MERTYKQKYEGISMEHRLIGHLCDALWNVAYDQVHVQEKKGEIKFPLWVWQLERDVEDLLMARLEERLKPSPHRIPSIGPNLVQICLDAMRKKRQTLIEIIAEHGGSLDNCNDVAQADPLY